MAVLEKPCHVGTRRAGRYARVYVAGRGMVGAHVLAWEKAHGPIPDGAEVCHHCDNPPCDEPTHLFVGSHGDNMADARQKGRWRPEGHGQSGARNGRARLTADQVAEIRAVGRPNPTGVRGGWNTVSALAVQFSVSRTQVRRVLRGASW